MNEMLTNFVLKWLKDVFLQNGPLNSPCTFTRMLNYTTLSDLFLKRSLFYKLGNEVSVEELLSQ
jgi:hypothetical protein